MANKKILFTIEIDGSEKALRNATELKEAIKGIETNLKTTTDQTAYDALENQLLRLKAELKGVQDEQRQTIREFEAGKTGEGSYVRLNAELVKLKQQFRQLSEVERNADTGKALIENIQRIDGELKDLDASIGQFQRSVGNYPQLAAEAFSSIPGFSSLNEGASLFQDGLKQISLTASATGKVLVGAFIGFQIAQKVFEGVQAIREFSDETNNLRGQIGRLSSDTEAAVDVSTSRVLAITEAFGQDQEEVLLAANTQAKAFGISFDESLTLIEKGFLAGADSNGKYLDALGEMAPKAADASASAEQLAITLTKAGQAGLSEDEIIEKLAITANQTKGSLDELIVSTDAYTQKQQAQLASSRALADAKVRVSKELAGLSGNSKSFANNLQSGLLNTLSELIEAFAPIGRAFSYLGTQIMASLVAWGLVNDKSKETSTISKTLGVVFDVLGGIISGVVYVLGSIIGIGAKVIAFVKEFTVSSQAGAVTMNFLSASLSGIVHFLSNLPAYFSGATSAGRAFAENLGKYFKILSLDSQILWKQLKQLVSTDDVAIQLDIDALRKQRDEAASAGKTIGEAFREGYNSVANVAPTEGVKKKISLGDLGVSEQKNRDEAAAKQREAAQKKIDDEAKKEAEARKKANEAMERYFTDREALLRELSARIADQAIDAIENQTAREIAAENLRFERVREAIEQQDDEAVSERREQRTALLEVYKEGSEQLQDFDRRSAETLRAQRVQAAQITEAEARTHERNLSNIRKAALENQQREQLEAVRATLRRQEDEFSATASATAREVDRAITGIIRGGLDADSNERILRITAQADIDRIRAEGDLVAREMDSIAESLDRLESAGITDAVRGEFDQLTAEYEQMYNDRAALERQLTEATIAESNRREQARLDEFASCLETFNQFVSIADGFLAAQSARELADLDEKQAGQEARIEQIRATEEANIAILEEAARTARGAEKQQLEERIRLEKQKLEERVKNEEKGLEELSKKREAIEKQDAQRAKRIAIIQSIIATALSVTKALGSGFIVPNVPAGILAGILGGAQTALIAAQPAAEGALIGGDVPHQSSGLVIMAQNIPTLRNRDNVLATVRRGEVVLNQKQQREIGGAPVFRALRVPGFNAGGIVGGSAPIGPPDLSGVSSAERIRMLEEVAVRLEKTTTATNQRLDRLRVLIISEDVRDSLQESDRLVAAATLL